MDVGGPAVDGLRQQVVHEADDGRRVGLPFQNPVLPFGRLSTCPQVLQQLGQVASVRRQNAFAHGGGGRYSGLDPTAGLEAKVVHHLQIERVGHHDPQSPTRQCQGQHALRSGHASLHPGQRLGLRGQRWGHVRKAELTRQGLRDLPFGREALPNEDVAQASTRACLVVQGLLEGLEGHRPRIEEDLTEELLPAFHG